MVVIVYTKSYKYHHQHYLNCQIVKCWILDSVDNLLWKSISLTSLNFAINHRISFMLSTLDESYIRLSCIENLFENMNLKCLWFFYIMEGNQDKMSCNLKMFHKLTMIVIITRQYQSYDKESFEINLNSKI